ncbi:cytochrome P450 [Klebsormidium nitens]|uniref:Cytochrome P450 n=1 Tax=Klebsormidium nitens TaxID=105231 RepID=A0A1Y1ITM4_KLENI|nr:cytochrome P450 [Klebsormidium nitens]|eukprot:GAQ93432.1 cytochrome P450 [Klebsormidium nitens]
MELLGSGIFNADGDNWTLQRKTAVHEFSVKKLREHATAVFQEQVGALVRQVDHAAMQGTVLDLQDVLMSFTLESICHVGFGVRLVALTSPDGYTEASDFAKAFNLANQVVAERFLTPVVWKPQDLLSRFMTMRDGNGALLSDAYLRDVVINFINAGRDTSAGAITWMIYELTRNCHVEERILEEVMVVLELGQGEGERLAEQLSFGKVRKLNYLQAALSETLRLHPSVPQDRKTAVDSDVLPDGTQISRGSLVVWTAYTMGRQESIWGPDALEFRPERWLAPNGDYKAESSYKFTAFQGGPRMCIGKDLAFLEMKAAAAALIYNYRFEVVPGHHVKYEIALTMPIKHGLLVNVSRRWS